MVFTLLRIAGAFLVDLEPVSDERGTFARWWCQEEFATHGIRFQPVQASVGVNPRAGTLRGLHFQLAPEAEAKYIRCTRGSIWDVVVDLRPESPAYRAWCGIELRAAEGTGLFVPAGCAHGYQTLEADTEVQYMMSARYAPALARGVRFDDPRLGIRWPREVTTISERDRNWPLLPD